MLDDLTTPVSGPNPLRPDKMSGRARFEEIGRILAAGAIRLNAAQSGSLSAENGDSRANNSRSRIPALLKGLIFSDTGAAMTPTSTKKAAKLYRYYVSMDVIRNRETGEETAPMRLAAGMVEDAVVTEVRRILQTPEVVSQVLAALKKEHAAV